MSFLTENMFSILIAILAILLFIKLRRLINYFSDRGIHAVDNSWRDYLNTLDVNVFNNLPNELYERFNNSESPYIGFFGTMMKPQFLILDPSLVENILIKDFSHFQDHGFEIDFKSNPLAGHLFNMKGDEWRTLRHKLVPTFTSGKLKGMVPIIEECADKLIEEMKADSTLMKNTILTDLYKRFSLSVIVSCAFGIDPEGIKDPMCEFKQVLGRLSNPNFLARIRFLLTAFFPSIVKLFNIKIMGQEVEDFMLRLTKETLAMRVRSGEKRNDFIQLLLELKEKGSVELDVKDLEQDEKESIENFQKTKPSLAKLEFTDELLMAQVFVFLVGGLENTAYLVAITDYLLSTHPDIQSKVRDEVIQARDKYGSVDYQALKDMKLLGACIDEALRIYTPAIIVLRECCKPYTFSDGKVVEKGMSVLIPAKSLHMDSRYWNDPEKFDPYRFLNGENIRPGTYMPFGDGPRICIAQRLALIIAKVMVAKLLLNFELLPSSKTQEPLKLKILLTADFEGGLWGSFKELKR